MMEDNLPKPVWLRKGFERLCEVYPELNNAEIDGRLEVKDIDLLAIENQFEYKDFSKKTLDEQIAERCPCFAVELSECPCLTEGE